MARNRGRRGQFIILAAALILIVMVSVVVFLYTNLPSNQIVAQNVLGQVNSVESSADKVVAAGASYYSTILNVTGNYTYATQQSRSLVYSGFNTLSNLYSYYGLTYTLSKITFSASWYSSTSYTYASTNFTFNLTASGLNGIRTSITQELVVHAYPLKNGQAVVNVEQQEGIPVTNLGQNNFYFEVFSNTQQRWVREQPTAFTNYGNGNYSLGYPGQSSEYLVGVIDQRGIFVLASSYSQITYTFPTPKYNPAITQPFIVQIYNNGTMSMLGEGLTPSTIPIPPVPVKDISVNETNITSNGPTKPFPVPFQVEDWASNYTVPLGLAGNETLFSNFQMIVAMILPGKTQSLTVYWNGSANFNQTPYAIPCTTQSHRYFSCPGNTSKIQNGPLTIATVSNTPNLQVQVGNQQITVSFVVDDNTQAGNAGGFSYTIIPGVVREIIQVEPESGSGFGASYSTYFQDVYLIPAGTNYIEVFQRAFFVNVPSGVQRTITQLVFAKIVPPSTNGAIFIQYPKSNYPQAYFSVKGTNVFDQYNTTPVHLWGMYCSSPSSSSQGDPCSLQNDLILGYVMSKPQLDSLYAFTNYAHQNLGSICGGGVLASNGNNPDLEIDPVLAPTCPSLGIQFNGVFTVSWWGLLWFSYNQGPNSNMDPYVLSQVVESQFTVTVSA